LNPLESIDRHIQRFHEPKKTTDIGKIFMPCMFWRNTICIFTTVGNMPWWQLSTSASLRCQQELPRPCYS
jgi:hypothetical protein